MRRLLKALSFSIVLLLVIFGITINISANDYTEVLVNGNVNAYGRYKVEENIALNELPYGLKQRTDISYLSAGQGMVTLMGHGVTESFVPGKEYPQQVNVMEVPVSTDIKITSWSMLGKTNWNFNTVRSMAADYERKNPGYKVIGAINGDFFDINSEQPLPKTTNGAHVSNGEFYKSKSGPTVGFTNNGTSDSLVGGTPTRTSKMLLSIYDENNQVEFEFEIDKINQAPGDGETAIYYPYWTEELKGSKELNKQNVTNGYIVGDAINSFGYSTTDYYGKGVITKFGNQELVDGQFAIVTNNSNLDSKLGNGVLIRAQYEYTGAFADIKDATGAGVTLLKDGVLKSVSDTARHPRTMIGKKADGTIVMVVVDGRQPSAGMYGASQVEMSAVMKHYGVVEGYNLDGGGSSTMAILKDGQLTLLNSPSDGGERTDANALLVVAKVPEIEYSINRDTNSLSLDATITNYNGHDFTDLYAGIGEDIQKLENKKANFNGLESNSKYTLKFYKKIDNTFIDLGVHQSIMTIKKSPIINAIYLRYEGSNLVVLSDFYDPDLAIERSNVTIAGKTSAFTSGRSNFYNFNDILNDIKISISIDLNDGKGRVSLESDFRVDYHIEVYVDFISDKINDKINKIFE